MSVVQLPYGLRQFHLKVIDDTILMFRLKTIYKLIKVQSYEDAKYRIIDLIDCLTKTDVIDISRDTINMVIPALMLMKVELAMNRYNNAHGILRDLQMIFLTMFKESDQESQLYW